MGWKPLASIFALVVVASATGLSEQTAADHVLDLLTVQRITESATSAVAPEDRLVPSSGSGGGTHEIRPRLPLEVTLLSLDRTGYLIGEDLIFEVVIRNTGNTAFRFPSSLDGHRFRRGMPGARLAVIGLTFQDSMLSTQRVALQLVYGAEPVTQSFIVIRPGETLGIRAQGQWLLKGSMPNAPSGPWARQVNVKAEVLVDQLDRYYPTITSTNAIPVRLEKR